MIKPTLLGDSLFLISTSDDPLTRTAPAPQYFAHRILPGVLVQEIKVRNPTESNHMLELLQQGVFQWEGAAVRHDRYEGQGREIIGRDWVWSGSVS